MRKVIIVAALMLCAGLAPADEIMQVALQDGSATLSLRVSTTPTTVSLTDSPSTIALKLEPSTAAGYLATANAIIADAAASGASTATLQSELYRAALGAVYANNAKPAAINERVRADMRGLIARAVAKWHRDRAETLTVVE